MEVTFFLNEQKYTIRPSDVPIDTSLLVFIRSYARLTGTKFMCLEGGCGACVVNVSGIRTPSGESRTIAVNACLWPVYACNDLSITTVEGIGNLKNGYHPVQKALYHFNGTQCGYCSPGMVMNMYSLLQSKGGKVSMKQVENSFGGNICRCTGYRPILDAFKSLSMDSCSIDIEDLTLDACKMNANGKRCSMEGECERKCRFSPRVSLEISADDGKKWLRPANLSDLLKMLTTQTLKSEYMLVGGNTAHGVYRRSNDLTVFIDIKSIPELHTISANETSLTFGANVSLTELMETLEGAADKCDQYTYAKYMAKHLDLVATVPVRNAGTIAGNLSIKHAHNEFQSDVFLLLETIGAQLNIISVDGLVRSYSPKEFLSLDMRQKVIVNVVFPKLDPKRFEFRSYKIMPRAQNAHAMVNAGFLFEFEANDAKKSVKSCRICYGGINPKFIHAEATEKLLTGVDDLCTNEMLEKAIKSLQTEIAPDSVLIDPPADYRKNLAVALFYRFVLNMSPQNNIKSEYSSGALGLERPLSSGSQTYQTNEKTYPLTQPVTKYEGLIQCTGEAEYVNDMFSSQTVDRELWAAFVPTTQVHSKVVSIDASEALKIPGVEAFFSAKDIPGDNIFAPANLGFVALVEDEPIFIDVDKEIQYNGQPCGVIVAKTLALANLAATKVAIVYQKSLEDRPIVPSLNHWLQQNKLTREIVKSEEFKIPPNQENEFTMLGGESKIQGDMELGAQFHFSMEPQTTFCMPNDDGGIKVYCATQWFDLVHFVISKCLKIPQSKVVGGFKRIGGAYGAKFSRTAQVACACALACHLTHRPVRFVMTIESNMNTIGKRTANFIEYDVAMDASTGRLGNVTLTFTQDKGCTLNEDIGAVQHFTLIMACYARASEWKYTSNRLNTDAPSTTWCRSPGTCEAIATIENIMEHIACETGLDPAQVRLKNLDTNGPLHKIFPEFLKDTEYYQRKAEINEFNKQNRWRKKGIAVATMRFPLHYFTGYSVYIAIYHGDGTVVVHHSGAEMGQGINTKVSQVVAHFLGVPLEFVTVTQFDVVIGANRSATAGSIGSEMVSMCAKNACDKILARLKPVREKHPNASWTELIHEAWSQSVDLTQKELLTEADVKGYTIVGCTCTEIELDVLTGNLQILRVDLAEDVGSSMSPLVDVGQIEGAFIMGVGYWLTEKLLYDGQTGELATNRTWTYKVPGAKDIPIDFRVKFIPSVDNEGIFGSKATGEPSFTLSVAVVFALRHAIDSVRADNGRAKGWYRLGSGNTPDVIFNAAEVNTEDFKLN